MANKAPIIFIQGPTGTGKSKLSLVLAKQLQGSIINCDSVQAYKHVSIGSAKPTVEEKKIVPHYLYDEVDYPEELTAGVYRRKAMQIIEKLNVQQKAIFVVGGSGFYFQALEKGMLEVDDITPEVTSQVEQMLSELSKKQFHQELQKLDPESANRIEVADTYRIQRALCLNIQHKKTLKQLDLMKTPGLENPILKIGLWLERDELLPLVEKRTHAMFEQGFVAEVESLLDKGFSDWWPLSSVGYKEVVSYLNKEFDLQTCKAEIIKNTLRLAKKQRTWFKRDKNINWFNPVVESRNSWQNINNLSTQWLQSGGSQ